MCKRFAWLCAVVTITFLAGGCSHMRPGNLSLVKPASEKPRAGNVYLLRGWIGIFSSGIDQLTGKINDAGVRAHVYQDDQWRSLARTIKDRYKNAKNSEPLVLIGHSYGADDVVRVAREVGAAGVKVDLLITLDPVTPPQIPANVMVCQNYYRPGALDVIPVLRGVPVKKADNSQVALENLNIKKERADLLEPNSNHFNIEKNQKIHTAVINEVLTMCPQRRQWTARSRPAQPPVAAQPQPSPAVNASAQ